MLEQKSGKTIITNRIKELTDLRNDCDASLLRLEEKLKEFKHE